MAALHVGAFSWTITRVLRDQKVALIEMMQAYKAGHGVRLLAYVLWRPDGEGRYVGVEKTFHLCFSPSSPSASAACWPERSTELFESLFLSRRHMSDCLRAHPVVGEPLRSVQASRWSDHLKTRLAGAIEGGAMLAACKAILLTEFMQDQQPSLPGVVRMLQSEASHLAELSQQNHSIHGVLLCTGLEEHRVKTDMGVVVRMFDTYRTETIRFLSSDSSCNFEALRYTIQSDFAVLFSQLREHGVLTADACGALAAVDDSLECILVSVAQQIAHSIPSVQWVVRDSGLASTMSVAVG